MTTHGGGTSESPSGRTGTAETAKRATTRPPLFLDRLFARIVRDPATGCWLWTGARSADGYSRIRVRNGSAPVHRVLWEIEFGPIQPGLDFDHAEGCPRHCVNPAHGRLVPAPENRFWTNMRSRGAA